MCGCADAEVKKVFVLSVKQRAMAYLMTAGQLVKKLGMQKKKRSCVRFYNTSFKVDYMSDIDAQRYTVGDTEVLCIDSKKHGSDYWKALRMRRLFSLLLLINKFVIICVVKVRLLSMIFLPYF